MSFMLCGLCAQLPWLSTVAKELMTLSRCSLRGLRLWKTSPLVCLWVFQFCFLASRVCILGVHSSAREMRPAGSDDPPFDKWHTHPISENQCAYVCLDVLICWVLSVSFKRLGFQWSGYLECQHEHFLGGKAGPCAKPFCQIGLDVGADEWHLSIFFLTSYGLLSIAATNLWHKYIYCLWDPYNINSKGKYFYAI